MKIIMNLWRIGRFALDTNCSCFYTCDTIGEELIPKLHQCPGSSLYSPTLNRCSYSCRNPPTEVTFFFLKFFDDWIVGMYICNWTINLLQNFKIKAHFYMNFRLLVICPSLHHVNAVCSHHAPNLDNFGKFMTYSQFFSNKNKDKCINKHNNCA